MGLLPAVIYVLSFLASATCTWLLLRGYRRSGTRLLLWSGLCFGFLSVNSLAILADILLLPTRDLQFFRHLASLAAVTTLLFGLIWEGE